MRLNRPRRIVYKEDSSPIPSPSRWRSTGSSVLAGEKGFRHSRWHNGVLVVGPRYKSRRRYVPQSTILAWSSPRRRRRRAKPAAPSPINNPETMDTVQNTVDLAPLTWVPSLNPCPCKPPLPVVSPLPHFSSVLSLATSETSSTTAGGGKESLGREFNVASAAHQSFLAPVPPSSTPAGIIMFVSNKLP